MKRLNLKKETLTDLGQHQLAEVVGGTATYTCGCTVTSGFTGGASCAGVCSGYCPGAVFEALTGTIGTIDTGFETAVTR